MNTRMLGAALIAAATAAVATGTAGAIVPANGGDASGTTTTINNGLGDQTEPHVSGDLAVYTNKDYVNGSMIHYFDFITGLDRVVPAGAPGDSDNLSDVDGHRIVFSRTRTFGDGQTAVMLFDTVSGDLRELDPQPTTLRFGAVGGGDIVAYQELAVGNGDIHAYDLVNRTATDLSQSSYESDGNLSPSGAVVVWERCVGSNCDILQSARIGGVWGAPTPVAATLSNEANPDTDGATVVYDSARPSATADEGAGVRSVRMPFQPGDEALLHVFEAPSPEALRAATQRSGLECERVEEAVER
jgi:hypothetical protein